MRRGLGRWRFFNGWLRGGGVGRKLLTFLVLLAIVVALLPLLVAKTPLLNVVLSAALPSDAIRVTAREASLSWISGPSLSGLEVRDSAGGVVFAAERITLDRAPLYLLMGPRELGTIEVIRPTLNLKVRPDGSNLEDIAQTLRTHFSSGQAEPVDAAAKQTTALAVQVVEGTILIEDAATNRRWRIDGVAVQYDTRGATGGLGRGSASAQIAEIGQNGAAAMPGGRFSISLQPADAGREQLALQVEGVPLAAAEPWLRRFVAGSELSGTLSGQGTANWTATAAAFPTDLTSSGTLAIDRLDATAPRLLGDRVRLARVELPWRLTSQPTGLAIEDFALRTDVGQVALRGRLDPKLDAARHDLELRGSFDIARLAAMLPHALRIRADTTITSGAIEVAGRYQPHEGGQIISGSVRAAQLSATSAGKPFRWDQPVDARFALRRAGGTMQLDTLQCNSKFLKIDAAGDAQKFVTNAAFDLDSLAEQLGQFVDLSGTKLAGTGTAKLNWQHTAADQFSASASGELTQLIVSLRDGAVWSEPQLEIRADAAGALDPNSHRPTRVDSAKLAINGQGDELYAQLTGTVGLSSDKPAWPLAVRATGRIARWLTRVRPWFAPDPWQVDGQSELSANVRIVGNMLEARDAKLVVTGLRAAAPGWNINESRVELAGDVRWDGAVGELASRSVQLVTSTVSLATKDIHYRGAEQIVGQLTGAAAFRADLARLAAWRATADRPAQYQPKGELTGNVRFAQQADRITGELSASGQNLALLTRTASTAPASRGVPAPGYETIWQEPQLALRGTASYERAADRLVIDQFQIQSNTLQAAASGQIQNVSTAGDVNLNGALNYDLAQITPLLRPYVGNGVQLTGREQARFAIAGKLTDNGAPRALLTGAALGEPSPNHSITGRGNPVAIHWSRRVRAQLELPWGGANVYGLPFGAGRLAANLADGAIRVQPLSLTVGEGQLTAVPYVRFDPQPSEVSLPAGPLLTNVRISPEVSNAMLKYVAPVLAGVTQSEGAFSMQLDGTRVPLAEPKRADAAGRLTVHSVRVAPGPMARELIGVAQQIEALAKRRDPSPNPSPIWGGAGGGASRPPVTLLTIRDQQVNFRIVEGRVHHQNLEFQVGDVAMRTQGSVGLDETLALTLFVPIQDAWIAKEPLLAGLKGQSLQVPVSGTLTRPKLDERAIANLSGQLIQNAAGQAIGGELNKALDKLFKSR